MPSFIKKGRVRAWFGALFLASCGCDHYVDDICVNGSVDAEDVRSAIEAVGDECSLRVDSTLTISFLEYAPERSEGGSPIPAHFLSQGNRIEVWSEATRPFDILRHELIHAALHRLQRDLDGNHTNPELWCGANMKDSCEARVRSTCYSE